MLTLFLELLTFFTNTVLVACILGISVVCLAANSKRNFLTYTPLMLIIGFASLHEGIDATTPAGRLQLHILAAIAEFERGRIQERVMAGLARARAQGVRLGRPKGQVSTARLAGVAHMPLAEAATALDVSLATVKRWRKAQKSLPIVA